MNVAALPPQERIIWQGYPSWADHALLFLFMGIAGLRAALAFRGGEWMTAMLYLLAIGIFLGIAALFRYTQFYQISSERIRVVTGLWRPSIRELHLDQIRSVSVRREILNGWFDLGSLEIVPKGEKEDAASSMTLKGIPGPERVKRQLVFLAGLGERTPEPVER